MYLAGAELDSGMQSTQGTFASDPQVDSGFFPSSFASHPDPAFMKACLEQLVC